MKKKKKTATRSVLIPMIVIVVAIHLAICKYNLLTAVGCTITKAGK